MVRTGFEAVVIGGSAGALEGLSVLLPALPPSYPLAVAVVLHLPPLKPSVLVDVLAHKTSLTVKTAEDKEALAPGIVYVAPPDYHLLVEARRTLALSVDDPVHFSRPSIDVLFESAADALGPHLVGVLLSGANADGASGIASIKTHGGLTIVQAPDDASTRVMPEAALASMTPDHVLPVRDIASLLASLAAGPTAGGGPL